MNYRRGISEWTEALRIAVDQLRAHKVRSLLTALGVIIGIVAVTLMGTAIKGIDKGFTDSLDMLGQDVLFLEKWPWRDVGDDWVLYRNRPNINLKMADEINASIYRNPYSHLRLAVPTTYTRRSVRRDDLTANEINVMGTVSDYSLMQTADILAGRFFTFAEEQSRQNVVVIGYDVAQTLFPAGPETAIDQRVSISAINFQVVGVIDRQGSFLGMQSFDKQVVMPLSTLRKFHGSDRSNSIRVQIALGADPELAVDELTAVFRTLRGQQPGDDNNFEINRSEAIEEQIGPIKTGIALAGFFITGLALFVGAIGIMNITFVSVKERTREIGTRRAIGARRFAILIQFLIEAVFICLLGGLAGVLIAFGLQQAIAKSLPNFPFVFSMDLVLIACTLSILTGVFSGLAPAWQAARLDPANALRHE